MKARIFEDTDSLNEYLENIKSGDIVSIQHSFQVVGQSMVNKAYSYQIVDRFIVVEK